MAEPTFDVRIGEALEVLSSMEDESVHSIVTSPPYWQLRDYGHADQLGLEATPDLFVERLVGILREARRVLRRDGTLWLNLGDTYVGGRCRHSIGIDISPAVLPEIERRMSGLQRELALDAAGEGS